MNTIAKAFAPGNISCIFAIHENPDPEKTGSTGLGFTINEGATVEVSFSDKTDIFFNNQKIDFPTVNSVITHLMTFQPGTHPVTSPHPSAAGEEFPYNIQVNINSSLPLGGGFGLSGASALATAYAINTLLDVKKSRLELAKIAHVAEVENKTGLGDVTNQYFGGCLLKTVDSSQFIVHKIPIVSTPIYCKYFSKLSTRDILSDTLIKEKINKAAEKSLNKIQNLLAKNLEITLQDLLIISNQFANESGLLQDRYVKETIEKIISSGGHASMIMLGNAVVSDTPFSGALKLFINENKR